MTSKNCKDINGEYNDKNDKGSSLSNLLIKKWFGVGKLTEATHVELKYNDLNELIVTAWDGHKIIATKTYKEGEYACDNNGLVITWTDATLDFFAGVTWEKITLAKASDSSLVVIHEGSGIGMLLVIIPFAADVVEYSRYQVIKK